MQALLFICAISLAAILGLAAQRASICSVVAVEEVLEHRRADMLISFLKAGLWVVVVTITLTWLAGERTATPSAWQLSWAAMLGGLVFGVGAAVNGGCAISTLRKLACGRFVLGFALLGFVLGAAVYGLARSWFDIPESVRAAPALDFHQPIALAVLAVLLLWMVWELFITVRRRQATAARPQRQYELSLAASLIGISNGILYGLLGAWMYTGLLGQQVDYLFGNAMRPLALFWLLFLALLVGMLVAALLDGRFQASRRLAGWSRHLLGGGLMGLGAASIPGGNDVILLHGIPSLSPHAVPVFIAMLAGIAISIRAGLGCRD
jgi:uncharacterized membrane protein YedE/YeeE